MIEKLVVVVEEVTTTFTIGGGHLTSTVLGRPGRTEPGSMLYKFLAPWGPGVFTMLGPGAPSGQASSALCWSNGGRRDQGEFSQADF